MAGLCLQGMKKVTVIVGFALVVAGTHVSALAGSTAWTSERVSGAINYAERDRVVLYAPLADRPGGQPPRGAVVEGVQATRDFHTGPMVQTKLCWNGVQRCIAMTSRSLQTHAFDGLDARGPFYLVHRVSGKRPLAQPLFIKGSVTVWYR
jgi:flagellar protein FlhE